MKTLAKKLVLENGSATSRWSLAVILVVVAAIQVIAIKSTLDKHCLGPLGEEISVCYAIYDYQKYGAH